MVSVISTLHSLRKEQEKIINYYLATGYVLIGLMIIVGIISMVTPLDIMGTVGMFIMFFWVVVSVIFIYYSKQNQKDIDEFYFELVFEEEAKTKHTQGGVNDEV